MSCLRTVLSRAGRQLIQASLPGKQLTRTTVIVRREKEVGLTRDGHPPKIKQKHRIYEVVVNKNLQKAAPIKVILTDYVEGLGDTGDVVEVKARVARKDLFPSNKAVYASPENLEEFASKDDGRPKMSPFTLKTIRMLKGMNLLIPMNAEIPWEINKSHIRIAFRKLGVEVPEDVITLPDEPVCEPTEFKVQVLVNDLEPVEVNAVIQPLYKDPEMNSQFVKPKILTKASVTDDKPTT